MFTGFILNCRNCQGVHIPYAGAVSPTVLSCYVGTAYVPLRGEGSESVPAYGM